MTIEPSRNFYNFTSSNFESYHKNKNHLQTLNAKELAIFTLIFTLFYSPQYHYIIDTQK